jgi:tRNA(Arg) A34 adenosine deaminase TadA
MRFISLLLTLALASSLVLAHEACTQLPASTFGSGTQKCDCDYVVPPGDGKAENATQYEIDLYWLKMVHNYSVTNMAKYPFGAALVDNRTNTLVQIGFNNFFTGHEFYSSIALSHAETVVMTNATINNFPGTWIESNLTRRVAPDWKFMILYGNIEACPMCTQAAVWRGIRKMVYAAPADLLRTERCWSQPTLSAKEVCDHNAKIGVFDFVRGPFPEIMYDVVRDFRQQCTNAGTTGASGTTSGAKRNAESPFEDLMESVRAHV